LLEEKRIAFADIRHLFKDFVLVAPSELPEDIARAVNGIEIIETEVDGVVTTKYKYKLSDKGKSLERISRHLGLYNDKLKVDSNNTNTSLDFSHLTIEQLEEKADFLRKLGLKINKEEE